MASNTDSKANKREAREQVIFAFSKDFMFFLHIQSLKICSNNARLVLKEVSILTKRIVI